jgi:ABC-type nickel/cobalt efflux system permease component RcnA
MGSGEAIVLLAVVAVLLGLRHATDPDHLTAVSTLIAAEDERSPRMAGLLGLAWGLGHATTLLLFGIPIVLFDSYLPDLVLQGAEVLIGVVIVVLAARLLLRWRRGRFHAHPHRHGDVEHRHLHAHSEAAAHDHEHAAGSARTPLGAYGIGLVHGMGGSAGVGILLLAAIPDHVAGLAALAIFALFTAISMAIASTSFGYVLTREPVRDRLSAVAPVLGVLSLAFGVWYALGALDAVPYYL